MSARLCHRLRDSLRDCFCDCFCDCLRDCLCAGHDLPSGWLVDPSHALQH